MKKFLPTILFFCLFLSASFSQTQLQMGVRGGINLATYHYTFSPSFPAGSTFKQPGNATLLTVGIPVEVSFGNSFALQAEFNFIQKGLKSHTEQVLQGVSFVSDNSLKVNWLEIPILAKFRFGSQRDFGGGLFVGPSVGYGINGRSKFSFISSALPSGNSGDNAIDFKKDGHSRVDLALNLGAEINYGGIFLDTRYQLGLTNMVTTNNSSASNSFSAKTQGITLTVGYRLPIILGTEKAVKKKKK
jgi:Outer membrane protein beta-barrel domain